MVVEGTHFLRRRLAKQQKITLVNLHERVVMNTGLAKVNSLLTA